MTKKIQFLIVSFFCLASIHVTAQISDAQKKYTAFDMRNNGKIYVVVAVILIILLGMFLYLMRLDKKISSLEKRKD